MRKHRPFDWPKIFESLLNEGTRLAARWLPKGTAELERQVRLKAEEIREFHQRRQKAATLVPRKSRLLWVLPLPLIPATVIALGSGQFTAFIANACAYGLFVAGAMLTRKGFRQEVSQRQKPFQTPRFRPYKTLGGLTVALATVFTAWAGAGHDVAISLAFGCASFGGFALLYGLSPKQEIITGKSDSNRQHVNRALQNAEEKIITIEEAAIRIRSQKLRQSLTRVITLSRKILVEIARSPEDIRRARKFLNTYLDGTSRVVIGYAETPAGNRTQELENNFHRVLVTIEDVFEQQHQRLLENDLRDLDINMEVLEKQLKHEGF